MFWKRNTIASAFLASLSLSLSIAAAACESSDASGNACCKLVAINVCDCTMLNLDEMVGPAVSSGDQESCQVAYDEVLSEEGVSSGEELCDYNGDTSCFSRAMRTCD